MPDAQPALKVFGIGLNKTGTTTLATCLQHLGYRHQSADRALLLAWRDKDWATLFAVTDRFDSFEDWPFPLMWRELYERYGDKGRYILTTRKDGETWLKSIKDHSLTTHPTLHARTIAYGCDYPHGHEAEFLERYQRHNDDIRAFFATPERAPMFTELCWEAGHGWPELCGFLGREVPGEPFPHSNRMTGEKLKTNRFTPINADAIKRQLRDMGISENDIASALPPGLPV